TALPTIRNGQGGRSCTCDLLVPNPDTSGLLTLHPGKWLPDLDSHQDKRLNRPPCYFDTTWQMALPTGFPPASFRLEDGCLMYSTTAAIEIGQRGRTCTCDRSVPSRVCWLLHYALMAPAGRRSRAGELVSCGNGE